LHRSRGARCRLTGWTARERGTFRSLSKPPGPGTACIWKRLRLRHEARCSSGRSSPHSAPGEHAVVAQAILAADEHAGRPAWRGSLVVWSDTVDAPVSPILGRAELVDFLSHGADVAPAAAIAAVAAAELTGTSD